MSSCDAVRGTPRIAYGSLIDSSARHGCGKSRLVGRLSQVVAMDMPEKRALRLRGIQSTMDDMIVDDPYTLFQAWFDDAQRSEPSYPDAMTVTTVGADGMPSTRVLLLKGLYRRGFVFYTNQRSRKGRQLAANPHCALCFFWKSIERQLRVEGNEIGSAACMEIVC